MASKRHEQPAHVVRRLCVVMMCSSRFDPDAPLLSADELDRKATRFEEQEPRLWDRAYAVAQHYAAEMRRKP